MVYLTHLVHIDQSGSSRRISSDSDSPPPEPSDDQRTFVYINLLYNDGDY